MIPCASDRSINIIYLEAPLERVWWSVATPSGSNTYLTYYSSTTGEDGAPKLGDRYQLNYGDIMNDTEVVHCEAPHHIIFADTYESMDPDGETVRYEVSTSYTLVQEGPFVKLVLEVRGFTDSTAGQWLRECLEMGWRRSLMNLKSVLELGLDLRVEMFSYPRVGVANCTVTEELSQETGVAPEAGNYLLTVFPNSPMDQAGLRTGDVVTAIDGVATPDYPAFVRTISTYYGRQAEPSIEYIRDGAVHQTTVRLSLDDTFTGLVDIEETSWEEIRRKREALAQQRSGSGALWKRHKADPSHP
ncbi:SRPBCC family protein [Paenibacillus massiliensis]|uniref:SRPBCC family protein n=1 Tax=Paenibacillus massiliensis TaxID=225917 RepID=UPI00047116CB|nr:SRPBCC domain-containing protein [Paenibacillus massiliensis]